MGYRNGGLVIEFVELEGGGACDERGGGDHDEDTACMRGLSRGARGSRDEVKAPGRSRLVRVGGAAEQMTSARMHG